MTLPLVLQNQPHMDLNYLYVSHDPTFFSQQFPYYGWKCLNSTIIVQTPVHHKNAEKRIKQFYSETTAIQIQHKFLS